MLRVLAENNFGDTMSDGLAGPMGLLIIVLLAIATVFLIRNMNSRLRRLPERFPPQPGSGVEAAGKAGGTPAGTTGSSEGSSADV